MNIKLSPKRVAQLFSAVVLCLVAAQVVVQTMRFLMDDERLFGLVPLFSLGSDRNLPTFYSTFAIMCCALLLAYIGFVARSQHRGLSGYWYALAAIFSCVAIDEMLGLHEHSIEPLRNALGASGLFYYAWVIPYGLGTLVLAIVFISFLKKLPARTAKLFVLAGVTFVAGALGFEMIGGWYFEADVSHQHDVIYILLQTVEEILEMVGIIVFLYALTDYIDRHVGDLRLSTSLGRSAQPGK